MFKIFFIILIFISIINADSKTTIVDNYLKIIQKKQSNSFEYIEAVSMLNGYLIGQTMVNDSRKSIVKNTLKKVKTFDISQDDNSKFKLFGIAYEFSRDEKRLFLTESFINEGYVKFNQREIGIEEVSSLFPKKPPYDKLFTKVSSLNKNSSNITTVVSKPKNKEQKPRKSKEEYFFGEYISHKQTLDPKTLKPCIHPNRSECEVTDAFSRLFRIDGETYTYNKGTKDVVYEKVLKVFKINSSKTKELYVIQNLLKSK